MNSQHLKQKWCGENTYNCSLTWWIIFCEVPNKLITYMEQKNHVNREKILTLRGHMYG